MKQDQKTLNTKKALAASLKKFMKQKPLSKITVSQLISDCNVNRKTFYYHFEDIYDLLKWTLEEEAIEVVKQYDLLVDYPSDSYYCNSGNPYHRQRLFEYRPHVYHYLSVCL